MEYMISAVSYLLFVGFVWLLSFGRSKSALWKAIGDKYDHDRLEQIKCLFSVITSGIAYIAELSLIHHYGDPTIIGIMILSFIQTIILVILYEVFIDKSREPMSLFIFVVTGLVFVGFIPILHTVHNSGSIQSVELSKHDMVLVEQSNVFFDHDIAVLPILGVLSNHDMCGDAEHIRYKTVDISNGKINLNDDDQMIYVMNVNASGEYTVAIPAHHSRTDDIKDDKSRTCVFKAAMRQEDMDAIIKYGSKVHVHHLNDEDFDNRLKDITSGPNQSI